MTTTQNPQSLSSPALFACGHPNAGRRSEHGECMMADCLRARRVLAQHGYPTTREARENMVSFVCLSCGSIAAVTPPVDNQTEAGRVAQRDAIDYTCCGKVILL